MQAPARCSAHTWRKPKAAAPAPSPLGQVDLLQRLERIMPSQLTSHFFCNSGSGKSWLRAG